MSKLAQKQGKRVTISCHEETKNQLSRLGNGLEETYDTVLQKLILNASTTKKEATNY